MMSARGAAVLPQGASNLLTGTDANIWITSGDSRSKYYVAGALQPWPGIQDGIILAGGLKGLSPTFRHLDLKAARQPGVTWTGTVFDTLEMGMQLEAHAKTPQGLSAVTSEWISMWNPTLLNTVEYWTLDRGYWYAPMRRSKPLPDVLNQMPRTLLKQDFNQTVRCDTGFWLGMPSIATFAPGGSGGSDWISLTNIGEWHAYPTLLLTGPGIFSWSNGDAAKTSTMITFGPLAAGQKVLVGTNHRKRQVVDLTNTTVAQPNTPSAGLLSTIINFVTNNNVPPLLRYFESLFGVLPPQGPLYSLLHGQYTNPIPGVRQPHWATETYLAVSITGGNADSRMVARIDPERMWPE